MTKYWTGAHGTAWDIANSVNWTTISGTATYTDGDAVVFDDTHGAGHGTVNIAGTVSPTVLTINNAAQPYTFSGNGAIAGPVVLNKDGTGTLSVTMTGNTYYGGTNLNDGVLQIGASGGVTAGPLGTGPLYINGGTLAGDGGSRTLANAVVINGNVTFDSVGGNGVTLDGPNTVAINGAPTITMNAPTTINDQVDGALAINGSSSLTLGAASNGLTSVAVDTASLIGTVANIAAPVALSNNGNVTYGVVGTDTLNYVVSGNGSMTKTGGGTMIVGTPQTYTGATMINQGTLQLNAPIPVQPMTEYSFIGSGAQSRRRDPRCHRERLHPL